MAFSNCTAALTDDLSVRTRPAEPDVFPSGRALETPPPIPDDRTRRHDGGPDFL